MNLLEEVVGAKLWVAALAVNKAAKEGLDVEKNAIAVVDYLGGMVERAEVFVWDIPLAMNAFNGMSQVAGTVPDIKPEFSHLHLFTRNGKILSQAAFLLYKSEGEPLCVWACSDKKFSGFQWDCRTPLSSENQLVLEAIAFDLFKDQKLAAIETVRPNRAERRQMLRRNIEPPTFHRVLLRKREQEREEGERRFSKEWNCHWIVRGHWRKQWYPSEEVHKPVFIEAYTKGDFDKPLKQQLPVINIVNR